jgi:two-component system sensor histidine kinase KdpD
MSAVTKNMSQDKQPGKLKLFLGYAAGVGKTYKMLDEAQQLSKDRRDVVVAYFEPHGRAETIAKTQGLEIVQRRKVNYRGLVFEEMDTDSVLTRKPAIAIVDELAHTNVPGTPRSKRWEDVMVLLDAGINVFTTMNVQHIESLNDRMRQITGIEVRETVPDWVVKRADEIVLVDLPPQALLNRLQRGVVYSPEKAKQAMENFFKEHILGALREVAMRQIAHEVEVHQLEPIAELSGIAESAGASVVGVSGQERILIHISDAPSTAALIRRGRRVADYLRGDCIAVCVLPPREGSKVESSSTAATDKHLDFARKLRIETHILRGEDAAETLVDFARRHAVTQIFLAKPSRRKLSFLTLRDFVMKTVRLAKDMQVIVVADRRNH